MSQFYLCQDCYFSLREEKTTAKNWKKYHQTDNSCPICGGDMCGCRFCEEIPKSSNYKHLTVALD